MYNKIQTPIFEKQKMVNPIEKFVFQLSETRKMVGNKKVLPFQSIRKSHANMGVKTIILLCLERLSFLIKRAKICNIYKMNNIKSIDKDIIKETDTDLVNILLFGSSKYQYHVNSKILSFSIDFILKTERFSGQLYWKLDNVNNANL